MKPSTQYSDPVMYTNPETYTVSMPPLKLNDWQLSSVTQRQLSSVSRSLGFSIGTGPFASLDPCRGVVAKKDPKGLQVPGIDRRARHVWSLLSRQGRVEAIHPELASSV